MSRVIMVVGAAFGDEGKGLMTNYFCNGIKAEKKLVVRYNGGAQAGHTVIPVKGDKHVFHHFGCGTLEGIPTYLDQEFIVNPILFKAEYFELSARGLVPKVFVHNNCRMTVPFDMLLNQLMESTRGIQRHGSCGVGIFETIKRYINKNNVFTLEEWQKMSFNKFLTIMNSLREYAGELINTRGLQSEKAAELLNIPIERPFFDAMHFMLDHITLINSKEDTIELTGFLREYDLIVFEGAQGLLLGERAGQMPHCTPSDPGITLPLLTCRRAGLFEIEICYVTRAYTTRHGAGFLDFESTPEEIGLIYYDPKKETNVNNEFQGSFRFGHLNSDKIKRAIELDLDQVLKVHPAAVITETLAVTCLDHCHKHSTAKDVFNALGFSTGYTSYGPMWTDVDQFTLLPGHVIV